MYLISRLSWHSHSWYASWWFDIPWKCTTEEDASEDGSESEVSQHDEACAMCHKDDDHDMLLCDGCPKVFHLTCLGLRSVPPGQWFCAVCNDGDT